jgi:hypothetical protein
MAKVLLYLFSFLMMQVAVSVVMLSSLGRTQIPIAGQYVLSISFSLVFSWLAHGLVVRIVLVCRARRIHKKKRS